MELIRELSGWRGFAEMYRHGDRYLIVSTTVIDTSLSPLLPLYNFLSQLAQPHELGSDGEEETLATWTDDPDSDKPPVWNVICSAVGPGSRDKVMAKLKEML